MWLHDQKAHPSLCPNQLIAVLKAFCVFLTLFIAKMTTSFPAINSLVLVPLFPSKTKANQVSSPFSLSSLLCRDYSGVVRNIPFLSNCGKFLEGLNTSGLVHCIRHQFSLKTAHPIQLRLIWNRNELFCALQSNAPLPFNKCTRWYFRWSGCW